VALRISDLTSGGSLRRRGIVLQQKTGRPEQFEITDQTRRSIAKWLERRRSNTEDWLFPSRQAAEKHMSTRQYSRLMKHWVTLVALEPAGYGTHSLRRTKVSLLYRKTRNLRACQLLLGHTKLESTVRYLGVELDDALQLSEALEL
jgi:integrase